MDINTKIEDKNVEISIEGRLDTMTAPSLDAEMQKILPTTDKVILNLEKLEYISSAGLRVLLSAHKVMMKKGGMTLRNVSEEVMEVFEVTGFSDLLSIE